MSTRTRKPKKYKFTVHNDLDVFLNGQPYFRVVPTADTSHSEAAMLALTFARFLDRENNR